MNLSILHTSASLTVQENASKDVLKDISAFLSNLAPESANYLHDAEGADDMRAHLKTLITNTNLTVSVFSNKLLLQMLFHLDLIGLGKWYLTLSQKILHPI